jgi:hypothetical protein
MTSAITQEATTHALAAIGATPLEAPAPRTSAPPMTMNIETMREIYQIASIFSASNLVPECYRGGEKSVGRANCFAALSMGFELNITPMQALSHIVVVKGRPAIDGQLAISLANARAPITGGIQYDEGGEGDKQYCRAFAVDKETGEERSYKLTIADAKKAGWFNNSSSHWNKDPRLMLRYRAASYLVRTTYPDAVMGLHTVEELEDATAVQQEQSTTRVMDRLDEAKDEGGSDDK